MGNIYTACFNAVAITAAQDVFELVAPANSRVVLRGVIIGQYSDAGDAQDELLSVLIIRGHGTTGSGGSAPTPTHVRGIAGAPAAGSTVAANNTTVATTGSGSPKTLIADTFDVRFGWRYAPEECERIILAPSDRLVVRITAPADSITTNGTLIFEEIGKMPIN